MMPPAFPARAWKLSSFLLLMPLFIGACQTRAPHDSRSPAARTVVEVNNGHWEDLTIYLERDGVLNRLGTVDGNTTRQLRVSPEIMNPEGWVRLVAMETGRRVHTASEVFALQAGEEAVWRTGPRDHPSPVFITP